MSSSFQSLGIRLKLILIVSGFSTLVILGISITSYQLSKTALKNQSFRQLTTLKENKRRAIESYFNQIINQIVTLSQNKSTVEALDVFDKTFNELNTSLPASARAGLEASVQQFYTVEFIPRLEINLEQNVEVGSLMPVSDAALTLQEWYISGNPNPTGKKNELFQATDSSSYNQQHADLHPFFNTYLQKFGYYDIFLVNMAGDIVYSVYKEVDFGTNLINGPYRDTNIAEVFLEARDTGTPGSHFIKDFGLYKPSYNAPASFIACPVFKGDQKIGALIFQMPVDNINSIMSGDNNWENDGLGATGETYLVGSDQKMRSISRFLVEDRDKYIEVLSASGADHIDISNIEHFGTSILFQPVNTASAQKALQGLSGNEIVIDYRGEKVLSSYAPLDITGLDWAILSEIDKSEAFGPIFHLRNIMALIGVMLVLGSALLAYWFAGSFTRPILHIIGLIQQLAKGVLPDKVTTQRKDEVGATYLAVNELVGGLRNASDFAHRIGEGKFDHEFTPASEEDDLGNALCQMRDKLADVAAQDKIRSWQVQGEAKFGDILRNNANSIKALSEILISNLVRYLEVNQGAIFTVEYGEHDDTYLERKASYAYGKKKHLKQQIGKGEGLIGQCWLEGETIYLTEVPEDYITISSGLGKSKPRSILIVPLVINDEVMGIIELAGFKPLAEYEIALIEKIAASIASTFKSVKTNDRTRQLLEESEKQAGELQQQEEEMRQNMEEMQATQEAFNRKEKEYLDEIGRLKAAIISEEENIR